MSTDVDPYENLGRKRRLASANACLEAVRLRFPSAQVEDLTGFERSYWLGSELVAHSWPVKRHASAMWLRMRLPAK